MDSKYNLYLERKNKDSGINLYVWGRVPNQGETFVLSMGRKDFEKLIYDENLCSESDKESMKELFKYNFKEYKITKVISKLEGLVNDSGKIETFVEAKEV